MSRVTPSIIMSSIEKGHHFLDTKFAVSIPGCGKFIIPAVSIFLKCCIGNLRKRDWLVVEQGEAGLSGLGVGKKVEGIITGQTNKN